MDVRRSRKPKEPIIINEIEPVIKIFPTKKHQAQMVYQVNFTRLSRDSSFQSDVNSSREDKGDWPQFRGFVDQRNHLRKLLRNHSKNKGTNMYKNVHSSTVCNSKRTLNNPNIH